MSGDLTSVLCPEDALLFLGSRTAVDAADLPRFAALTSAPLDWRYVVNASIRHGVAPLLADALAAAGDPASSPEHALEELRRLRAISTKRHDRLYRALRDIVSTLRGAGVEVLALKDVALAVTAYPRPGQRPIGDIDLSVRRDAYETAARELEGLGFRRELSESPYLDRYGVGQHFCRESDDLWVDLQWNVAQREWDPYGDGAFTFDPWALWNGAAELPEVPGLFAPSPEVMLVHLALHLEGHRYGELILFSDVAELLRAEGARFDWSKTRELACELQATSALYHVLLLARALMGASVPQQALDDLLPAYFSGPLVDPLFGNLASLHESLDEIHLAMHPPTALMHRLEAIVRRQAVVAMAAWKELDGLAADVKAAGAAFVGYDGRRSQRTVPTENLPGFEPLTLVLAGTTQHIQSSLARRGFHGDAERMRREIVLAPRDPRAAGTRSTLALEIALTPTGFSNRRSGAATLTHLRALATELLRRTPGPGESVVEVQAQVIARGHAAVTLAERMVDGRHARLFGFVDVVRALQGEAADLDSVASVAAGADPVVAGVLRVAALVAGADGLVDRLADGAEAPRLLERARLGAQSQPRHSARESYLRVFTFVAADRRSRRALLRGLGTPSAGRAFLRLVVGVSRELLRWRISRDRAGDDAIRDVFWADP
jgi:hypothetical protein